MSEHVHRGLSCLRREVKKKRKRRPEPPYPAGHTLSSCLSTTTTPPFSSLKSSPSIKPSRLRGQRKLDIVSCRNRMPAVKVRSEVLRCGVAVRGSRKIHLHVVHTHTSCELLGFFLPPLVCKRLLQLPFIVASLLLLFFVFTHTAPMGFVL